jgi:quercetin dioxygenase-like cupin family protein
MGERVKHVVGHLDWSFADTRPAPTATASGLVRQRFIGWPEGAVHTDLSAIVLQSGGWLAPHVHSYEEALYILEGEVLFLIGERVFRVTSGDYTLMPTGMRHGLANTGSVPARFISLNSPQKQDPGSDRTDTYFEAPQEVAAWEAIAGRPAFGDPTLRYVGHYEGTGPQLEALAVRDPARGRAPAGADTAILAYSGISVKMLVDRTFGADHTTMFTVDYEIGGSAQQHDHPFEETYVFLAGEVEAELDGETHTLRLGDVVFAGVGSVHGFYNTGSERVRWIETQAPQPPVRHAYRWLDHWRRFEEG